MKFRIVENAFNEALAAKQRDYKTTDRRTKAALGIHYDIWKALEKMGTFNDPSREAYNIAIARKSGKKGIIDFLNKMIEKGIEKTEAEEMINKWKLKGWII